MPIDDDDDDVPDICVVIPPEFRAKVREYARRFGAAKVGRVELHDATCPRNWDGPCDCSSVTLDLHIDPRCDPERN